MDKSDNKKGLAALKESLSARKKIAMVIIALLVGMFVLDIGGPSTSEPAMSGNQNGDSGEFSELDSLLATFDEDDSPVIAPADAPEESETDDVTGIVTMESPSDLNVPPAYSETQEIPMREVSHSEPILSIPAADEMVLPGGDPPSGSTASSGRPPSIRLTGKIYPIRQPLH